VDARREEGGEGRGGREGREGEEGGEGGRGGREGPATCMDQLRPRGRCSGPCREDPLSRGCLSASMWTPLVRADGCLPAAFFTIGADNKNLSAG
jgi:hypothetical protein